jgi:hypothetical protein
MPMNRAIPAKDQNHVGVVTTAGQSDGPIKLGLFLEWL